MLHHITVTVGETLVGPRPPHLDLLAPGLHPLIDVGAGRVPRTKIFTKIVRPSEGRRTLLGTARFSLQIDLADPESVCTLNYVCWEDVQSKWAWEQVAHDYRELRRIMRGMSDQPLSRLPARPPTPWLATMLCPSFFRLCVDDVNHMPDVERHIAWAIIDRHSEYRPAENHPTFH